MKFRLEPAICARARSGSARHGEVPRGTVFTATRPALPPGAPTGPLVVVATLADLDVVSEDVARAELRTVCQDAGSGAVVVVRLGADRFVDVRGLRVLLDAAHAAARDGRRLVVVDPPHTVLRMLDALDLRAGPVGLVPPAEDDLASRPLERSTS